MRVGSITVDGRPVGVVTWAIGNQPDLFTPDLSDYVPEGRASEGIYGGQVGEPEPHRGGNFASHPNLSRRAMHETGPNAPHPRGGKFSDHPGLSRRAIHPTGPQPLGRPENQGSAEVNKAIEDAAKAHHLSPAFMKSVASIESGMDPSSNANRATQYKGLFQMGVRGKDSEWARFGNGGNPYNAHDNAMAAARAFEANSDAFKKKFGRAPTDTEMYLMHQQGLGFYTNGTMTNIAGNLPAHARTAENMTHEGFERYWGNEVLRRERQFNQQMRNETPNVPEAALSPSATPHANYMKGPLPSAADMTSVSAGGRTFVVNKKSADALKGFVDDIAKSGAPIHEIGGWSGSTGHSTNIAGSNRISQHAYGNAIDINQSSRNVTSRDFEEWRRTHASDLRAALQKWNIVSGGDWRNPDWGHFEWGGGAPPAHSSTIDAGDM